jgi:dTDP-4-amino-4,6-dideoxygalactose transaminase
MKKKEKEALYTGSDTEGGITSGYQMNDGVKLKVPYSFFGSIYDDDDRQAVLKAMKQDSQTMGPQVQLFQKEFANIFEVKHAFATNSCTTSMHVATQVFGIGEGDEVIITPVTFIATTLVVLKEGGRPVYTDIDPRTYNIDPAKIEEKITDKTKAIYVVHYGGQMCDMDPIMEIAKKHGLYVLEDCAHATGSTYGGKPAGGVGDIGCFSFHSLSWNPDDTEWTFGGYNLVKTDVKDYWIPSHFDVIDDDGKWGCNYRMCEAQAAVGRAQLKKLEQLVQKRRDHAHRLSDGIRGVKGLTVPYEDKNCFHSYHLYTLCVEEYELGASRDQFMRVLYREEGIQGILHYQPTYHFTALKKLYNYPDKLCPHAENFFYHRELNLPMHHRLTEHDIDTMIQGIKNAAEKVRGTGVS